MNNRWLVPVLSLLAMTSACRYDEGLIIENLKGTVKIPVAAGTATLARADGETVELVDAKLIGPVYLGLYSGVDPANVQQRYPYPKRGPQFEGGQPGDTYPYGGTTVGDFRFPCFETLVCRVVSGRYVDFDDVVDWWNNALGAPITDAAGQVVPSGDYMRQTCYDLLDAATDEEVRLTAADENDDGQINAMDLDFVLDETGNFFVADFEMLQQEFFWDQNQENCEPGTDCRGFSLWGFMDAPSPADFTFDTCEISESNSLPVRDYDVEFNSGAANRDVLNQPSDYIIRGDWVASEGIEWNDVYEQPELFIDFEVQ